MVEILEVTAPFFALILCGYLAARLRLLPEKSVPALNTFVLYFALPCMLFRFSAQTPFGDLLNLPVFLSYATSGLAMLGLFALLARFAARQPPRDAVYGGLAAAWSNWGYMGFALLPAVLGPSVLPIVVGAGMADLLVVVSATLALDSLAQRRSGAAAGAIAGALARVARNPLIWAIVAGGAFSAAGLALPRIPAQLARLLGDAAVPVALFTIGVSLYRPGMRWEWTAVLAIAGAKLLVHPLLVALVAAQLYRLAPLEVATLALSAALPVAGTVFLFAERAGANGERIAAAILVSTACAFFSFSALSWLLGAWAAAPIK